MRPAQLSYTVRLARHKICMARLLCAVVSAQRSDCSALNWRDVKSRRHDGCVTRCQLISTWRSPWPRGTMQDGKVQHGAVQYDAVQCEAMRCSARRCGAVRSDAVQCEAMQSGAKRRGAVRGDMMQCKAMRCSARRCGAVHGDAVQCKAKRFSVRQCSAVQGDAVRCKAMWCSARRRGARNHDDGCPIEDSCVSILVVTIAVMVSCMNIGAGVTGVKHCKC
jgi:hypothetical protein